MNDIKNTVARSEEQGSALIYILVAIALLAALTIAFMGSSSQQTQSQNSFKLVSELQSQADFIRSSVQECILSHPGGDARRPGVPDTYVAGVPNGPGESDEGADHRYPIKPNSTYFSGATVGATVGRLVKDIRCPGNPGDDVNHVALFGGSSGKFMPPAPKLFDDWQWYNGNDGVFFWISTSKTDSYIQTSLDKLNESFATCEADKINAVSGDEIMDSDGNIKCPSGHYCFRVWLKSNMATAVFPDESADCHP